MAALEVLTNKDLVENIYGAGFWRSAELHENGVNEWLLECMRELVTGTRVCRVFREACLVHLKNVWGGYERQMRGFDKCGQECQNLIGEAFLAKLRELVREYGHWPVLLFGFDAGLVRSATTADTITIRYYIKEMMQFVRPTTYDEMLYMMEGKCACCGGRCTYARGDTGWRLGGNFSAVGAPAHGEIVCSHYDLVCGCPVYAVQKQGIPHTWSGHLATMVFLRDEDGHYRMQVRLEWCAPMAPGERDAHHFIVGARNQPWYQPRIKRLFELRPARVIKGLRCCHRGRVALSDSGPRREIEFEAAVFLLTPRLPNNADWSIQQIFGLSRQETLACVRRGRLVLRERRLLAPGH